MLSLRCRVGLIARCFMNNRMSWSRARTAFRARLPALPAPESRRAGVAVSDPNLPGCGLPTASCRRPASRNGILKYAATPKILHCPGLGKPFNPIEGWFESGYGFVIGYNYLGGHTNSPWPQLTASFATWISPQTLNGDSSLPLVTDMNDWSPGYGKSFAPHGARGPILRQGDYANTALHGASSRDIGGVGGNV